MLLTSNARLKDWQTCQPVDVSSSLHRHTWKKCAEQTVTILLLVKYTIKVVCKQTYRTSAIEEAQLMSADDRTFQQERVFPQWEYHSPSPCEQWGQAAKENCDMRKSVSSGYANTKKWIEKTWCSRVFLNLPHYLTSTIILKVHSPGEITKLCLLHFRVISPNATKYTAKLN